MSEQDLKSWLTANKLKKILGALNENDIETLDDVKDTLETVEDIEELCRDMKLKVVLKKKFVKAVIKLNNITTTQQNASPTNMNQISGMLNTLNKDDINTAEKLNELEAVIQSMRKLMNISTTSQSVQEEKKQTEDTGANRKIYNLKGVHPVDKLDKLTVGKRHRTIMVIGGIGTGKTTLLNSMMNYLWNVQYDDPYRFELVIKGQTDDVSVYHLAPPALDYELTVIDTPGFGDRRGPEQDKKITKKIKKLFEQKIQEIDAICFVIKAAQARLTSTQKYIFSRVLSIFGKDVKENILVLTTFSDSQKPPALAALKAGNVPFKTHFKFNNFAFNLPEDDKESDMFTQMFWKMGISSFDGLFNTINKLQTKSLHLTKKVLARREELENYIESVAPTIRNGFTVLDKLRHQIVVIQKYGDLMNANKDFEYKVQVNKCRQIPNNGSFYTTTCLQCNYTCHRNCPYPDNSQKARCNAMDSHGYCRCCPNKCHWTMHKNLPYTLEWYEVQETRTTQALKDKYNDALSKKSVEEQVMAGSVAELAQVEEDLSGLISPVRDCLNELAKIALRPNVLSQDDYIDKLIQSEEAERKKGYQQRIAALRQLKEKQEMLSILNSDKYDPWAHYEDVQQFISQNQNVGRKVNKNAKNKRKKNKRGSKGGSGWFSEWF